MNYEVDPEVYDKAQMLYMIRRCMKQKRITRFQLASMLDISQETINGLLRGNYSHFSLDLFMDILNGLQEQS